MLESWHSYLAGIVDGEGCISIYRNKGSRDQRYKCGTKSPSWIRSVNITNTCHPLLDEILQRAGVGRICANTRTHATRRQVYSFHINSKFEIGGFLLPLLPYLYVKREQARVMLLELDGKLPTEVAAKFLKEAKRQ